METHEIADIFPLLPESELQEMADDIAKEGLRVPIITYQGKILDGRNREKACAIAGVTPRYEEYSGDDPIGFVISMNMKRRHLTVSQRAAIASELATATVGNPTFVLKSEKDNSVKLPNSVHTIEQTAKLMNVSPKSVGIARSILKNRPDVAKEVKAGSLSLSAAQALMKKENGGSAIKRRILNYLAKVGLQGSTTENLCQELGILIQTAYVDINSLKRKGLVTTKKDAEGKEVRCPTSSGRTAAVLVLASLLPQPVIVQPSLTPAEQSAAALKEVKMANQLAKKFGGILTPQLLESGFIIYQDANNNPCLLSSDVSELEHRDREEAETGGGSTPEVRRKLHRWEAYRKNEIRQDVLRILSRMKVIEVPDLQFEKGFTFGFDIARPEDLEELVTMLRADLMRMVQAKKQIASFADKKAAHP